MEGQTEEGRKHSLGNNDQDYLSKCVGQFGLWQATICAIASTTRFIAMWNIFSVVFLTSKTEFFCNKFDDFFLEGVNNFSCHKNCREYNYTSNAFETNLITEFGLICENAWLADFTQTTMMFGVMVGVTIFGWTSDRFGRRHALLIASVSSIILMVCAVCSLNYWILNALRFLIGTTSGGIIVVSIVYVLEIVGPKHRALAGCCALIPDGLSQIFLAAFAYYSSTWRSYMWYYTSLSAVIATLVFLIPESPRWLVTKGRIKDAVEVISNGAKHNKLSAATIKRNVEETSQSGHIESRNKKSYLDLFTTTQLTLKTISSIMIWFGVGTVYYGVSQYITLLGLNIYLAIAFSGLIQLPSNPLAMMLNRKIGRRLATFSSLLATGVFMTILTMIPKDKWYSTVFGILGIFTVSTAFAVIYVYVSELFPTQVRNMAYGLSSAGAKIGAMIAPFIASCHPQWAASMLFAILPITTAFICFLLPETKDIILSDDHAF